MGKTFDKVEEGDVIYSFDCKSHTIYEHKVCKIMRTHKEYNQVQISLCSKKGTQMYLWFPIGKEDYKTYSLVREHLVEQVREKIEHAKAQIETLKTYIDQLNHLI